MGESQLRELVRKAALLLLKLNENNGGKEFKYREYQMAMCMICSRVNEIAIERGCPATYFLTSR